MEIKKITKKSQLKRRMREDKEQKAVGECAKI